MEEFCDGFLRLIDHLELDKVDCDYCIMHAYCRTGLVPGPPLFLPFICVQNILNRNRRYSWRRPGNVATVGLVIDCTVRDNMV